MNAHSPLNVALVITELDVGGAERCLTQLACGLQQRGHRTEIHVLGRPPKAPRDLLVRRLNAFGVPMRFLGLRHSWQLPFGLRVLRQNLAKQQPTVVQSMLFHANVLAALASRGLPQTPLCWGLRVADPSRWRSRVERHLARSDRVERLVCVSRSVAQQAGPDLGPAARKLLVIPNGIDVQAAGQVEPIDLRQLGLQAGQSAISCVARLTRQKGIDRLIRASSDLLGPLPDHHLLLIGDGPDRRQLEQEAMKSPFSNRIHWLGFRTDVPNILAASDLMVLTSRWEGMPNVVLEAMAVGRPVACLTTDGVNEVLGPLAEPQTAPDNDVQTLIHKAVAISSSPAMQERLGRQNRARVSAEFSVDAMLDAYIDLFESFPPTERRASK